MLHIFRDNIYVKGHTTIRLFTPSSLGRIYCIISHRPKEMKWKKIGCCNQNEIHFSELAIKYKYREILLRESSTNHKYFRIYSFIIPIKLFLI